MFFTIFNITLKEGFYMEMHWIYAHLIGDYVLQNDWMAQNKKTKTIPALAHSISYMIPFLLCGLSWWQMILIFVQHFAIDRTQFVMWFMRIKGSEGFSKGPCAPWSIILTDNILHIIWVAFVVWLPSYI
jgi:hypothetical protein